MTTTFCWLHSAYRLLLTAFRSPLLSAFGLLFSASSHSESKSEEPQAAGGVPGARDQGLALKARPEGPGAGDPRPESPQAAGGVPGARAAPKACRPAGRPKRRFARLRTCGRSAVEGRRLITVLPRTLSVGYTHKPDSADSTRMKPLGALVKTSKRSQRRFRINKMRKKRTQNEAKSQSEAPASHP